MAAFTRVDEALRAFQYEIGTGDLKAKLRLLDQRAQNLFLESFKCDEPACFDVADYCIDRLVEVMLPLLRPTFDTDAPFAWASLAQSPCPLLKALDHVHTALVPVNKGRPRELLYDLEGEFWNQLLGNANVPWWVAFTALLSAQRAGARLSLPQQQDDDDGDSFQYIWAGIFDMDEVPGSASQKARLAMCHARALGLWDFAIGHPSVSAGLNVALPATFSIDEAEQCFRDPKLRNRSMLIAHFDALLAVLVQHSTWWGYLGETIILSASATQEILGWLERGDFPPATAAQQKFHWFMTHPNAADEQLALLPVYHDAHFVLIALWWEANVLHAAYLDSNWPGAPEREFYHYNALFRPFFQALGKVFRISTVPENQVLTFDRNHVFRQRDSGCGHLVLSLMSRLMAKTGQVSHAPERRVRDFLSYISGPGHVGDADYLEKLRAEWEKSTILKNVEWHARIHFIKTLEAHDTRLLESSIQLLELCAEEPPPLELLANASVHGFVTIDVARSWAESLPWMPPPLTLAALMTLASIVRHFPTPASTTIMHRNDDAWVAVQASELMERIEIAAANYVAAGFLQGLLVYQGPAMATVAEYWKALAPFVPVLARHLRRSLSDILLSEVFENLGAFETKALRAVFAQAQTPLDRSLPADTAYRFANENVLPALWPTEFCWIGPGRLRAWRPTHWLARDADLTERALDFLEGLADIVDIRPYQNMGANTGPVVIQRKPHLASLASFEAYLDTNLEAAASWRTMGAGFAVVRDRWTEEELVDLCGRVMVESVYRASGGAYQSGGQTERALANEAKSLLSVFRLLATLRTNQDKLLDPRLLWLLNGKESPLRLPVWNDVALNYQVAAAFQDLAREIEKLPRVVALAEARLAEIGDLEARIIQDLDRFDDVAFMSVSDRFDFVRKLVGARDAVFDAMASTINFPVGKVPKSWLRRLPVLAQLDALRKEYDARAKRFDVLFEQIESLKDMLTQWERTFTDPGPLWSEYFSLAATDLNLNDGSKVISILQRFDYDDYADSFGSASQRADVPREFETKYGAHLRLLDQVDQLYALADAQVQRVVEPFKVDKVKGAEVVSDIFALAKQQFADKEATAKMQKRVQESDVLTLLLDLMRHLFTAGEERPSHIFGANSNTYNALRDKLTSWAKKLQDHVEAADTAIQDVLNSDAYRKAATWFKSRLGSQLDNSDSSTMAMVRRTKSRILTMINFLPELMPVDSFDDFLHSILTDNAKWLKETTGQRLLANPITFVNEIHSEEEVAETLEIIGVMHRVFSKLFAKHKHGVVGDDTEELNIDWLGFQKFILLVDADARAATSRFTSKQRAWHLTESVWRSGIFEQFTIAVIDKWHQEFDPLNGNSVVAQLLTDRAVFKAIVNDGIQFRTTATLNILRQSADRIQDVYGAFDVLERSVAASAQALGAARQTTTARVDAVAREVSFGDADALQGIITQHNTAMNAYFDKEHRAQDAGLYWRLFLIDLHNANDQAQVTTKIERATKLFEDFSDDLKERKDAFQRDHIGQKLIRAIFPKALEMGKLDLASSRGILSPTYANVFDTELKLLSIDTFLGQVDIPILPFLGPDEAHDIGQDHAMLTLYHDRYERLSFGGLQGALGDLLEDPLTLTPQPTTFINGARRRWAKSVSEAVSLLDYFPFVTTRQGGMTPVSFFATTNILFRYVAPESMALVGIDVAFAALAADPARPFQSVPDPLQALITNAPAAFFAQDPDDDGALMSTGLHREVQGWVLATLRTYQAIPEAYLDTEAQVIDEVDALQKSGRRVTGNLPEGRQIQFYIPSTRRLGAIFRGGNKKSITEFNETVLIEKLILLCRAFLDLLPVEAADAQVEGLRRAVSETSELISEAITIEMDRQEVFDQWQDDDVIVQERAPLKDLEKCVDALSDAATALDHEWTAFRQKTGPVSRQTAHLYERKAAETQQRLRALISGEPLFHPKKLIMIVPSDNRHLANAAQEQAHADHVAGLAKLAALHLAAMEALIQKAETELTNVRRLIPATVLAGEPGLQSALEWTTSRFYRSEYEDEGDATRPAWLSADPHDPGFAATAAKFPRVRTREDEVLAVTTFTPAHRAALRFEERAREDALLRMDAEVAKVREIRALEREMRKAGKF